MICRALYPSLEFLKKEFRSLRIAKYNNYKKFDDRTKAMTCDDIEYVTTVIGTLSSMLGRPCSQVYDSLKAAGLINGYLVKCYDVLHTFSLEYVADDIINIMNKKGLPI